MNSPSSDEQFQQFDPNSPIYDKYEQFSCYRPPSISDSLYSNKDDSLLYVEDDNINSNNNDGTALENNHSKRIPDSQIHQPTPITPRALHSEEAGRGTRRIWWKNIKVNLFICALILTFILLLIFGILKQLS